MLIGSIAVYASSDIQSPKFASITKVEPNKVLRGTWNLTVTEIAFYPGSTVPDQKGASITIKMDNVDGPGKSFLPTGFITALVGESGKVYELDTNHPFDKLYTSSQDAMKMEAKEEGMNYEPGVFKIKAHLMVDRSEKNISKVIYQNEKGEKIEIPIQGIMPVDVQPILDAK
jgi:hypothetical protein